MLKLSSAFVVFHFCFLGLALAQPTQITVTHSGADSVLKSRYNPSRYQAGTVIDKIASIGLDASQRISADSLSSYLNKLVSFYNRNSGSDTVSSTTGIGAARRWIYSKFQEFGVQSGGRLLSSYLQFNQTICSVASHRDIFAVLPGRDTSNHSLLVVEGHMDSRCERSCDITCKAHGADDNGSGTVLVMELARVLSKYTFNQDMREVAPHYAGGVPRTWEKYYSTIRLAMDDATPLERWAWNRALEIGGRVVDLRLEGKPVSPWLRALRWLAEILVFRNVKISLGLNRVHTMISSAAPVSPELLRWYVIIGLEIIEGYGQTESGAIVTAYQPHTRKLGTVGKPLHGNEIKISPEGEILIRGPGVFMGYLNNPEKSAETVDAEGWLHTGDVGHLDEDGYVVITDRMKDIIITAGGKNITPSEMENELKFSPYIADAIVIGDRRKYLSALIMIDHENVVKYAQDHSVPFSSFASLTQAAPVVDLIAGEVEAVNRKFNQVEQVKKFRLISVQLTGEDEEMTPTMKLKRKLVSEKYRDLIESMYTD